MHKGNLQAAIDELKHNDNNAVAYVYENVSFGPGILNGAIVTIKDLYATIEAPTMASSEILRDFYPSYEATIVTKLKQAGAAIAAKTHLDELALGGTGSYSAWGVINNPLDKLRMPGGSSSGAVAAFSSNISLAIGSDTGNSVRLPASFCGLVGFKPSYGAISRYGMFAFAPSLDTVGFFTHNVSDAIIASQALFGVDVKDLTSKPVPIPVQEMVKPKTVAFLNTFKRFSQDVEKAYDALKIKLEQDGVKVNVITVPEHLLDQIDTVYEIISYSEVSSNDANLTAINFGKRDGGNSWEQVMIKARSHHLGKMVQRRFTLGAYYLLKENQTEIFERAQKVRRILRDTYNLILEKHDVLVIPTTTVAPLWTTGKVNNWTSEYSTISNLIGCPSISIPFTKEQNMPVGLLIDSKIYTDRQLLSHALYFEHLIGGKYE